MKQYSIFLFFFLLLLSSLDAHESRPLYLKITNQVQELFFELSVPNTISVKNLPVVSINNIALNNSENWLANDSGYRQAWSSSDSILILKGSTIKIEYPIFNPVISAIIAIGFKNGEEQILMIPPNKASVNIPKEVESGEVRLQYGILGVEHILSGVDHLLFLICLIIITGFSKRIITTITGFTIAHSVTLGLSALGIIKLPIPPIEASIALSIVFLCYEIIHHHQDKNSLTYRYPILVASSFGLLHGLGFAAVLGEIGLPYNHTIAALFFFNIGVEIGQIIFILALFVIVMIVGIVVDRIIKIDSKNRILIQGLNVAVYFVGILAAYWMFDRLF